NRQPLQRCRIMTQRIRIDQPHRDTLVVPTDVKQIEQARGFNSINRRDLQRLATIIAEVDSEITTPIKPNGIANI
ncbi:hypothetical protein QQ73_10085, partial [Candidatus Endoriftia persephone str. Guaymas]|nr:hypothetical protein [Candidatus Endoriftia persephone str. Guaymas]